MIHGQNNAAIAEQTERICRRIAALEEAKRPILVALDGRCGAGKTTLSLALADKLGCHVIHMDDFFLRPRQRTAERLATPGGNVDYERLASQVLIPLRAGKAAVYRPYSCRKGALGDPVTVACETVAVIEGSYACHSALWDYYDLRIFLDVDSDEQMRRILRREGTVRAAVFAAKWIPMEERYFAAYDVARRCELYLKSV